ncbi:MAG: alpha-amylase family glycosyl hydrolase [Pseudomonadota bacterium]|nr:alpha-amylase family glycosyl hydrolase [Pseudomonadota bacterium]
MEAAWWQRGVVYQVYPRSLQDSDGDGTGDLIGITRRLGDLRDLGVDAVWLSPIFPSPMTDFGYDVADYCGIDPVFGSMADFDAMLAQAHRLGLKLILDLVPNHTSDQHPWFQASQKRADDKADWYLWRDEPTNWMAHFGGSGWTWDAQRGQYFFHAFLPTQPDLNWRHPEVRRAMYDALRFWLAKGVDGFRVDVMWLMIKDAGFRDNPPNPEWRPGDRPFNQFLHVYTADRPEVHEVVAEMRSVLDEYADRVLIGEIYLPIDRLVTYYGTDGNEAQLPFNFHLLLLQQWSADALSAVINQYEGALPAGAWPNWVLGNHDRSRVATRIGVAQARNAAMLLLTLRGTPTIYMGDELGMVDTFIPPDALRDPAELREPGQGLGRDPERTPFPWDDGLHHGFTTGTPWLPLGDTVSRDQQAADPTSMFSLYRRLLAVRRAYPALAIGDMGIAAAEGTVLRYQRQRGGTRFEIALNLGSTPAETRISGGIVRVDTHRLGERVVGPGTLRLEPDQGVLILKAP